MSNKIVVTPAHNIEFLIYEPLNDVDIANPEALEALFSNGTPSNVNERTLDEISKVIGDEVFVIDAEAGKWCRYSFLTSTILEGAGAE